VPENGTAGCYIMKNGDIKEDPMSKFSRDIEDEVITNLKATDLWRKRLAKDCQERNVFLAIRDGYISFYHKGGGLFEFRNKGFSTNVKYSVVLTDKPDGYIYEEYLSKAELIQNFHAGYDKIMENCKQYSKKSEAEGVSRIYHKYPYNSEKNNVVVLDIEITAPGDSYNRIDILLFNKNLKKLKFIEAKLFDNDEIRSKTTPPVINQLERYRDMIARRKNEFLSAYQECTHTLNSIFDLELPEPMAIDDEVGLLIFGFDKDQRDSSLQDIIENLKSADIPCYSIGDIKTIDVENLWKKTTS
jgi:hypothetical protein